MNIKETPEKDRLCTGDFQNINEQGLSQHFFRINLHMCTSTQLL